MEINKNEFKDFISFGRDMYAELMEIFVKYLKKNPKTAFLHMQSIPINLFFNIVEQMDKEGIDPVLIEDIPSPLIRMLKPLEKIAHQWGKVSIKEFNELYRKEYKAIMEEAFPGEDALFEKIQ